MNTMRFSSLVVRWRRMIEEGFPEEERLHVGILLMTSPLVILAAWGEAFVRATQAHVLSAWFFVAAGSCVLISMGILLRTRRANVAGFLTTGAIIFVLASGIWTSEIMGMGMLWVFLSPLISFFLLPRRSAAVLVSLAILLVFLGGLANTMGSPWAAAITWSRVIQVSVALSVITLLVFFVSFSVSEERAMTTERGRRLAFNIQDLEEENERRMKAEVALRATVQQLKEARMAVLNVLEDTEAERLAKEQEQRRTQQILDELPVGVFVAEAATGAGILMNKVGIGLFGGKVSPTVMPRTYGKTYRLLREDGTEYPVEELPVSVTLRTGKPAQCTDAFVDHGPEGRLALSAKSAPLFAANGSLESVVLVFWDRTKEYVSDRAKTDFVSIASHQLNTPLNGIRWFAETMLSGHTGALKPKQTKLLKGIEEENLRMINLVSALLNVSRLETGSFAIKPKQIDLRDVAKKAVDAFAKEIAEKQLNVSVRAKDAPASYSADLGILGIIFQNLLSNSVKYTPEGGSVSVRFGPRKAGEEIAGRVLKKPGLIIEVADSGLGIPKSVQDKIFTKMFRADNVRTMATKGTGLGLYTIKVAVGSLGGDVWFSSKEDKGSTFAVSLPLEGMQEHPGLHSLEPVL